MEIKHTIEILTKDIQDIENLVRNFDNYPVPPQIEIDLAMAKLRNAYDLLTMISEDARAYRSPTNQPPTGEHQTIQNAGYTTTGENGKKEHSATGHEPVVTRTVEERPNAEEVMSDPGAEEAPSAAPAPPTKETAEETDAPVESPRAEPESNKPAQEEIRKASILAEKFAAGKSINEKIAPGGGRDLSNRLTSEAIDSIKRHIGLNDRFLIIRELLQGDNEKYDQLIRQLDECGNYDQALEIISSTFPEKTGHEGVEILVKLAKRKYPVTNG